MNKLRWWIACRLVGPILRDPYADEDGVFVVLRSDGMVSWIRLDKFRMRAGMTVQPNVYGDPTTAIAYGAARKWGRVVGTVRYDH